jgi:hypothetical protein
MATTPPSRAQQRVVALLRAGVPLSLLIDLVAGPRSADLYAHERPRAAR